MNTKSLRPRNALESVIVVRHLPPGHYRAVLRGNNGAIGVGVLEIYALH